MSGVPGARGFTPNICEHHGAVLPGGKVSPEKFPEINRGITRQAHVDAIAATQEAGPYRFDERRPLWMPLVCAQKTLNQRMHL